jgi:hypothetical protein
LGSLGTDLTAILDGLTGLLAAYTADAPHPLGTAASAV